MMPPDAAPPNRLTLWLYGRGNLWGSVAGLAGVALFFAGVIGPGWIAIVAGLYAVGALAAPRPKEPDVRISEWETAADIGRRVDEIEQAMKPAAGAEVQAVLRSIRDHAADLLPKMDTTDVSAEDLNVLHEILVTELPKTLGNYLKLPPLYRRYHALRDGKSAEGLLRDQLAVLDEQLQALRERVFRVQAEDLLEQERALKSKFRKGQAAQ